MHICRPCGKKFETEQAYLDHACEAAGGAKPTEKEHLIRTTTPHFDQISAAAKKRGTDRAEKAKPAEKAEKPAEKAK